MATSRLMVYVRVKPLLNDDSRSIIDVVDEKTLVFDPIDAENEPDHEYYYKGRTFNSIGVRHKKNSPFTFDHVFDTYATNFSIYETVTKPMVDATIDGINCSVFAYGATGSGKTFTMLGSNTCPGVIYHTSKDLFGRLQEINQTDPLAAEIKVCYFEIYNEKVRDLLYTNNNTFIELRATPDRNRSFRQKLVARDVYNLPICDSSNGDASLIPDLSYHIPTNADHLIQLLKDGNSRRSQHPTDANADSSRSHAIFQIYLVRRTRCIRNNGDSPEYELQSSKMSLIDLAGSERASVAYRAGAERSKNLQREGGNINKSLLALGNCINALANPKNSKKHIPYRDSKLTRLLRDSLGGKCRTAMIATICKQANHYDDIQNTLSYARRARSIRLNPNRNVTDIRVQPKNYNVIIDNQNQQLVRFQERIDQLEAKCKDLESSNTKYKQRIHDLEVKLANKSGQTHPVKRVRFLDQSEDVEAKYAAIFGALPSKKRPIDWNQQTNRIETRDYYH